MFKIIMVKASKTAATKLLYKFKEIGEKTFPHFLNRITAIAQKNAYYAIKFKNKKQYYLDFIILCQSFS